ncbi:hypothetical protein MPC4_30230 [Methylocella tundrae]|uniref:Uncharacterized protein n=2 Tax=Methylocella tundrae TaxID=227605 RepID=A0A8B6M861_METTU|nr:hypothetical protein MPC4_30230 [Methylocella tundrae]
MEDTIMADTTMAVIATAAGVIMAEDGIMEAGVTAAIGGTADGGTADGGTADGGTADGAMHKAEGTAMADAPGDGCSAPMAGIGRGAAGETTASGSLSQRSPARPQTIRASN